MEPIWQWGNNIIVSIQTVHNPVLDGFFNAVTFLGEPEFFLILFPLIIWSVNKSIGQRLAYLMLIGLTLNTWAKELIGHPRPYEWPSAETSPVLKLNRQAHGPGLPSGHTQSSLMLWFYLAYHFQKKWLWIMAAILFVLVSFSRVYLGVHFPTDLLGGAVLGLIILLLFIKFEDSMTAQLWAIPSRPLTALVMLMPLALIAIYPHPDAMIAISALAGFSLGIIIDHYKIGFEVSGSFGRRAARYMVGIIILVIIYVGLAMLLPGEGHTLYVPFRILRYAIAGFWVSAGAPWLFKKIRLA
jgi:membrane-associated phospholipid phosphatase